LDYFGQCKFPEPSDYIYDADSYFGEIIADEGLEFETRMGAVASAVENQFLRTMMLFNRAFQTEIVLDAAIKQYKRTFSSHDA
jgi:hypothetical protein